MGHGWKASVPSLARHAWLPLHCFRQYDVYDISDGTLSVMAALSIRLPEELERKLMEEVTRTGQPRSQFIREALETLLAQRQRERLDAQLRDAVTALASDPQARQEALELAEDFLPAENEALEGHWWR
jgi:Arc/MetJ-type ribon-helix-helix transcriptional regulator